jgi:NitT/TauT family transport system substrate-binding protein
MNKRNSIIMAALFLAAALFARGGADKSAEKVRIGFMPDPGALPLIVMDDVEAIPFMSARERDTALAAGELDGISGDMVGLLHFEKNGTPLKILTLTECRFFITAHPDHANDAVYRVGISENTVIEYLVDTLLAGKQVEKVAVPKVPVRLEMLRTGKLPMACLSDGLAWPLMADGFVNLVDQADTDLTPTILALSGTFIEKNPKRVEELKKSWNGAVKKINADPDQYHDQLLDAIRLPEAQDFPMPLFKEITLPTREYFDSVTAWYEKKYGISLDITRDGAVIR